MPIGIFNLIGAEHADRISRIRKPQSLSLMGDLSLAFAAVERQRHRGIVVANDDIERLVRLLHALFRTVGVNHSEKKVRELVEQYLAKHSLPDAVPAGTEPEDIVVDHSLLDELRQVEAEVRVRFPSPWGKGNLMDIGLGVGDGLSFSCCDWCSPINCATFASTGVDGTHFSLLIIDGGIVADCPVVMTTPANMGRSVIVGDNLFDFLYLGCRRDYLLDSLASSGCAMQHLIDANWYPGKPVIEWIVNPTDDYPNNMLFFLIDRLGLHPWSDASRFDELQQKHAALLRLPPDVR